MNFITHVNNVFSGMMVVTYVSSKYIFSPKIVNRKIGGHGKVQSMRGKDHHAPRRAF